MPVVTCNIQIDSSPRKVYDLAKNMERFSDYMPDVETVKVLERNGDRTITEWTTNIEGIPINWKEEDIFNDDLTTIDYRLIEGDLDKFEGSWSFEPKDGGTQVTLTVDFDFGMPTLADLLGPILKVKVQENSDMMLASMKKEIEG
ncbi:MAG TPA: cyclase [Actinobacteria bacterium]|nr:cyclase [Actinomycetota bacterium]